MGRVLPAFKPDILITWAILTNQRARNVTQNEAQTNYVPQAPHMGHSWGTQYTRPQDGKYLIFLKNLSILLFYLGLIYRWGKGLKPKMIKTVCFFYTICEKNKKKFFF